MDAPSSQIMRPIFRPLGPGVTNISRPGYHPSMGHHGITWCDKQPTRGERRLRVSSELAYACCLCAATRARLAVLLHDGARGVDQDQRVVRVLRRVLLVLRAHARTRRVSAAKRGPCGKHSARAARRTRAFSPVMLNTPQMPSFMHAALKMSVSGPGTLTAVAIISCPARRSAARQGASASARHDSPPGGMKRVQHTRHRRTEATARRRAHAAAHNR